METLVTSMIPASVRARFPVFLPVNWQELKEELPRYLTRDEDLKILILLTSRLFASGERREAVKKMRALHRVRLLALVERLRGTVNVRYQNTGCKPVFWCDEVFLYEDPLPFSGTCRAANFDRFQVVSDRQYHGRFQG